MIAAIRQNLVLYNLNNPFPMKKIILFLWFILSPTLIYAQEKPTAFIHGRILPMEGDEIPDGTLVVQHGKILAVGSFNAVTLPNDAEVIDVTGKVIMPGLVDTHSHLGDGSGGDRSSALNPEVRILDALDPVSDSFKRALAGGITTVNVMPGSGHLMSGQTVYIKLRKDAKTIEDLLFCDDLNNGICGGMKMANGTNSIRPDANFPGTRAKSAAMVRALFTQAKEYQRKTIEAENDTAKTAPPRDLRMEALVQILDGRRIVHFHTHRHDDVLTAIRLSEEFGFKVVLHHVSEAWKVAEEIAAANVPASIIVIDSPGGKLEAMELDNSNGAALEKAGALVGFHTDDGITDSRLFRRSAAIAVRDGMSRQKALEGLTIAGAKMLELDEQLGSLVKGKDADFVIFSGDPLSTYTHVLETWVEGEKVFDRSDPNDRQFATGGYKVYRSHFYLHIH
jgi:imidazolonepropionase-like amidohydrolase